MTRSPNRLLGILFGSAYVLIGILGFTVTAGVGFFSATGGLLFGIFEVNILHNVAHLAIGAALLIAGLSSVVAARVINGIVGTTYLVLGMVGLFLVGSALNILALNAADNVLHFGSAVVLLASGLGADKRVPAGSARPAAT